MNSYIHLIRHGITAGNENRWYYGRMDIPLTARGIAQLEKLRADGIYPNVQNADCYTSGMLRTEQTFQTIYGDLPHKTLPLLREMNFGAWEGMSFEEIEQDTAHKAAFDDWMRVTDGSFAFPEGGDSVNSFYARVRGGLAELEGLHRLKELSCRHNGNDAVSLVVCHGGVIAAAMEHYFPGERENFWQWIPDPGHGYTISFAAGKAIRDRAFCSRKLPPKNPRGLLALRGDFL